MNKCTFEYKGKTFTNEEEMNAFLLNNQYRIKAEEKGIEVSLGDKNLQDETIANIKLKELDVDFKEEGHNYKVKNKKVKGTTNTIEELGLSPKFDKEELKDNFNKRLEEEGLTLTTTRVDIEAFWKLEEERWEATRLLGTKYHRIAEEFFKDGNINTLLEQFKNNFKDNINPLYQISPGEELAITSFIEGLANLKNNIYRMHGNNVKFLTEVKLYGKNPDGKIVAGMLDLVVVKPNGNVVIYDYKTSFNTVNNWSNVKIDKMKIQLGIYRNMLSNMGIKVEELNIVPIQYTKLNGLRAEGKTDVQYPFDLITTRNFNSLSKEYTATMKVIPTHIEEQFQLDTKVEKTDMDMLQLFDYRVTVEARAALMAETFISKLSSENGIIEFTLSNRVYKVTDLDEQTIDAINDYFLEIAKKQSFLPDKVINYINTLINDPSLDGETAWQERDSLNSIVMARSLAKYANGDWRIFKSFKDAGVLMFLNTVTNRMDIVSLRYGDLTTKYKIENNNLLGKYGFTKNDLITKNINLLDPTIGNLELIKTVLLIQENKDIFNGVKIGNILAVSPSGSVFHNYSDVLDTIKYLNEHTDLEVNTIELDKSDNFTELHRYLMTLVDSNGVSRLRDINVELLSKWNIALNKAADVQSRIYVVSAIQKHILSKYRGAHNLKDSSNNTLDLLNLVSLTLLELNNEKLIYEGDLNGILSFTKNALTSAPSKIRNHLFQIVRQRIEEAQYRVSLSFDEHETEMIKIFRELKNSNKKFITNEIEGTTQYLYERMFIYKDGKNTMQLRDYNDPYLSKAESLFIKFFVKIVGSTKVPLMKATLRQKVADRKGILKHIKDNIFIKEFFSDDLTVKKSRLTKVEAVDLFSHYSNDTKRMEKIDEWHNGEGEGFELDLEVVLNAYVMNKLKVKEYNKELPVINSIRTILALYHHNALPNSPHLVDAIDTYISANMFDLTGAEGEGKDISPTEQTTLKAIKILKQYSTITSLAGNLTSGLKDLTSNTWLVISTIMGNKAGRNRFGFSHWFKGLGYVMKNSFTTYETNFITALNRTYRMSNRDLNSIAAKANHGTQGWFRFASRLLFSFNAAPDYLHRMAVFIAHTSKDGSFDAHTLVDGKLVYDIKKDKRFSELWNSNKNSDLYQKQLARFRRLQSELEKEGELGEDSELGKLPLRAYSIKEVLDMKDFSDSIFGRYDDSTKLGVQHKAYTSLVMQFKNYVMSRINRYHTVGREDDVLGSYMVQKGYYKDNIKDDEHWIQDEEKGTDYRDMWGKDYNEGIFNTLLFLYKRAKEGKGFGELKEQQKANLAMLASDLSLMALLSVGISSLWDIEDKKDRDFNIKLLRLLQKTGTDISIINSVGSFVSTKNNMASISIMLNTSQNLLNAISGKDITKNLSNLTGVSRTIYTNLEDIGYIE